MAVLVEQLYKDIEEENGCTVRFRGSLGLKM